jgi:hypothetical protein
VRRGPTSPVCVDRLERSRRKERVQLSLIEEVDLRVVVLGRCGLVDRTPGVGVGPTLRDGELEDPVEVDVEVADGLHGQLRQAAISPLPCVEAGVDEVLDVVGRDLVDGLLSEVPREVDPDLGLVVASVVSGLRPLRASSLMRRSPTSATVIRSAIGGGAEFVRVGIQVRD